MDKPLIRKDWAKWYAIGTGTLFLIITTYMRIKFVFDSTDVASALVMTSISLAVLTLVFGLLSLPKWQGWFGLAVSGYAFYILCFTRLYGIN